MKVWFIMLMRLKKKVNIDGKKKQLIANHIHYPNMCCLVDFGYTGARGNRYRQIKAHFACFKRSFVDIALNILIEVVCMKICIVFQLL